MASTLVRLVMAGAVTILTLAGIPVAYAFSEDGVETGQSVEDVRRMVQERYGLTLSTNLLAPNITIGWIEGRTDILTTARFCKDKLISYGRRLHNDLEYVFLVQDAIAKFGPEATVSTFPHTLTTSLPQGFFPAMRQTWQRGPEQVAFVFVPPHPIGGGKFEEKSTIEIYYGTSVDCPPGF